MPNCSGGISATGTSPADVETSSICTSTRRNLRGARVANWATRKVAGKTKRYDYPRWQFTNVSTDIRGLCCWALDLVDIPWRQSNAKTISVSTRAGVARLDELIGLKS
jgi:hypothetical protein